MHGELYTHLTSYLTLIPLILLFFSFPSLDGEIQLDDKVAHAYTRPHILRTPIPDFSYNGPF